MPHLSFGKGMGYPPEAHCEDTVTVGRFANDPKLVEESWGRMGLMDAKVRWDGETKVV